MVTLPLIYLNVYLVICLKFMWFQTRASCYFQNRLLIIHIPWLYRICIWWIWSFLVSKASISILYLMLLQFSISIWYIYCKKKNNDKKIVWFLNYTKFFQQTQNKLSSATLRGAPIENFAYGKQWNCAPTYYHKPIFQVILLC